MAADTCVTIDTRATTEWCVANCILGDLVHPACDPFVDDVHTVCLCDCDDGEIIQEESSTTSIYVSEETYDEEEEETSTTCEYVTFYSECDYAGDVF